MMNLWTERMEKFVDKYNDNKNQGKRNFEIFFSECNVQFQMTKLVSPGEGNEAFPITWGKSAIDGYVGSGKSEFQP